MRLARNGVAHPAAVAQPSLTLVKTPETAKAAEVNAAHETATPKQSALRAYWLSGGLLGLSLTGTSLLVGAMNSVTPDLMQRAVLPMVQSLVNTFNTIAGQQFVDRTSALLRRTLGYGVGAPRHAEAGALIPPKLEDDFMRTFRRKAGINNRVLSARNSFLMYSRILQFHISAVAKKLSRGEVNSAARLIAGVLVHDRALWFEIRPSEPQMLFFLRLLLSGYFAGLTPEAKDDLVAKVKAEIARIDAKGAANFGTAYAPLLGAMTEPLDLSAAASSSTDVPAETDATRATQSNPKAPPLDAGMIKLLARIEDGTSLTADNIALIADASSANPAARLDLRKALPSARFRKRVMLIIAARYETLKASTGRDPTVEEQWSLAQSAFQQAIQERNEARAAGTSAAMYVSAGVASSLAVAGIATQVSAATLLALNPVLFTMVGLLMSAAGSTFQDWLSSSSSQLNYQLGSEGVLMSEPLQREALSIFFRNATEDGRSTGQRNAFITFGQTIASAVMSAEDFIARHDLATAADIIARQLKLNYDLWFEMEASPNLLRLLLWKLTPHFDQCTMADRTELKRLITKQLSDGGRAGNAMSTYYTPFVDGMLLSNIPPNIENAPASLAVHGPKQPRSILGRIINRVFGGGWSR